VREETRHVEVAAEEVLVDLANVHAVRLPNVQDVSQRQPELSEFVVRLRTRVHAERGPASIDEGPCSRFEGGRPPDQYAFANSTRRALGLPVLTHLPG
jgi:hypothetical protein